jgi:hypothetical protein
MSRNATRFFLPTEIHFILLYFILFYSIVNLFIYSSIHSITYSFIYFYLFIHPFIQLLIYLYIFIYLFIHSFNYLYIFIHSSIIYLFVHLFIYSSIHSIVHLFIYIYSILYLFYIDYIYIYLFIYSVTYILIYICIYLLIQSQSPKWHTGPHTPYSPIHRWSLYHIPPVCTSLPSAHTSQHKNTQTIHTHTCSHNKQLYIIYKRHDKTPAFLKLWSANHKWSSGSACDPLRLNISPTKTEKQN